MYSRLYTIVGASVAQWQCAGLPVNMSRDQFITKFISLAQVVSGPVQSYSAELWPKTPFLSFSSYHAQSTMMFKCAQIYPHKALHQIMLLVLQWRLLAVNLWTEYCASPPLLKREPIGLQSCTRGMIHNQIHLISQGCPRASIALHVQNRGLKHHSSIGLQFAFIHTNPYPKICTNA